VEGQVERRQQAALVNNATAVLAHTPLPLPVNQKLCLAPLPSSHTLLLTFFLVHHCLFLPKSFHPTNH
jgi:hypothetical protein